MRPSAGVEPSTRGLEVGGLPWDADRPTSPFPGPSQDDALGGGDDDDRPSGGPPALSSGQMQQHVNILASLLAGLPFAVAGVVMVLNARHAKRRDERRWHTAIPLCVAAAALWCGLGRKG